MATTVYQGLMAKPHDAKLSTEELACALYEGTPHLQNMAEKLARQHGKAGALSFYDLMGDDVQNLYRQVAGMLIAHASEWEENAGSACNLSARESARLQALPRVPK